MPFSRAVDSAAGGRSLSSVNAQNILDNWKELNILNSLIKFQKFRKFPSKIHFADPNEDTFEFVITSPKTIPEFSFFDLEN